jgi:hypothetical protein
MMDFLRRLWRHALLPPSGVFACFLSFHIHVSLRD